jgi:hypothetical protein
MYGPPVKPAKPAKTKRLKAVFDTSEVPHVWAHPRQKDGSGFEQTDARNPQHNLFFDTSRDGLRILYSYRETYPIASRFTVSKQTIFLVRSGKPYSVTTSMHMNMAGGAVPSDAVRFDVPYVCRYSGFGNEYGNPGPWNEGLDKATHTANLKDYVDRIAEFVRQYGKARSAYAIESSHKHARELTTEIKKYAKLFRLKLPPLPKLPKLDAQRVADAKARRAQLDATREAREAARNAEALKRAEADIAAWRRGESVTPSWGWNRLTPYALLRVIRNPEDSGKYCVETSQCVRVPVSGPLGAARLLSFLESLKASGRTYQSNGHSEHIGKFVVSSFDGELLRAGCHSIQWQEVQSVADAVRKAAEAEDLAGIAWG